MGEQSGFRKLVGTELTNTGEGEATVSLRAGERHLNPNGTVHGGAVSTLVDVSMAEALNTVAGEDQSPVTVEIKVNYMRPGKPGTLVASARVRKGGGKITVIEAEVLQQEDGEVVALATGTYALLG